MALTPGSLQGALVGSRGMFNGPAADKLIAGIASGVASWAVGQPGNVALTGVATGTAGTGTIVPAATKIVVTPNPGVITGALAGAGVTGPLAAALATMVAVGVSTAFTSSAQYSGTSAGVGVGQDVSVITVANPGTLTGLLAGLIGTGPSAPSIAAGLGSGIATMLLGGTGTGTVTGTPAPAAATGATTSMVV